MNHPIHNQRSGQHAVVLCVAPNGARRNKSDHQRIPLTADELASTASECVEAGASVMHVHVRDRNGGHSLAPDLYREATAAIRRAVGDRIVVQITTEAVGIYSASQQMATVREVRPEAASCALRELVPDASAESAAADFFAWAHDAGIGLQYILYSKEDVTRLLELHRKGVIPNATPNALFVLGRYAADQQSRPFDLVAFASVWPATWHWSVCAFGSTEFQCMSAAIGLGGHARVGFENNLQQPGGGLLDSNAASARIVAQIIESARCRIASVQEARAVFLQ